MSSTQENLPLLAKKAPPGPEGLWNTGRYAANASFAMALLRIESCVLSKKTHSTVSSARCLLRFVGRPFGGIIDDYKRRLPHLKSDITDAFTRKTISR